MIYTNATYINPENTAIRVDISGITSFVPCAPGNSDYSRIQELVSTGELTISAYTPPSTPPITQVTMRQVRLLLLKKNLLDSVEELVIQSSKAIQIEWEYATIVHRHSELVTCISSQLGLNNEQIDVLFQEAHKL